MISLFPTVDKKIVHLGKGHIIPGGPYLSLWCEKPSVKLSSKESSICLNLIEAGSGKVFLPVAAENPEAWLLFLSCTLVLILIKQNSIYEGVFLPYLLHQ